MSGEINDNPGGLVGKTKNENLLIEQLEKIKQENKPFENAQRRLKMYLDKWFGVKNKKYSFLEDPLGNKGIENQKEADKIRQYIDKEKDNIQRLEEAQINSKKDKKLTKKEDF
ncbi:MAG: hypothetical protein HYU63_02030 [Armatimonadetes bacterium]|nr:hypothetical protein [Armatimonadota bacterium]